MPLGATYTSPAALARFGVYHALVRVFPVAGETAHRLWVTSPGRQKLWTSSPMPAVAGGSPAWFQPARHTSQLPAEGVPVPPPTESAGVRVITEDWRAGGMLPNADGWAELTDHWFGMLIVTGYGARPAKVLPICQFWEPLASITIWMWSARSSWWTRLPWMVVWTWVW